MKNIITYKGIVESRDCNNHDHMSMTQYVNKFDHAGQRFFLELGLNAYKNEAVGIVTIEQQTKYLKEAYEGDLLDIHSTLLRIDNKAFTVFQEMTNAASGTLISTMTIVYTFFDRINKVAYPFPKELRTRLT